MFCRADCIDDQKRPISGLLGIGAPSWALAIVATMFGSDLSSVNSAFDAGVPSGTSSLMVFRPATVSMWFSMNSTATSRFGEALEIIAPSTPTKGDAFLPPTDGILATPKLIFDFFRLSQAQGPLIIMAILPWLTPASMSA